MGITYVAKNGAKFDVNYSGASALGRAMHQLGVMTSRVALMDRVPYEMNSRKAQEAATRLAALSDNEIIADAYDVVKNWLDMTPAQFVEWVREWQTFLDRSGGYSGD